MPITRHITPIKYAVSLFGIFLAFILYSISPAYADKSYNATTVEECINEKACVWEALDHFLHNKPTTTLYEGKYVDKWKTRIKLRVIPPTAPDKFDLNLIVSQLQLYFPGGMSYERSDENLYVIFSDDINKDLFVTYRKALEESFGPKFYSMHPDPVKPDLPNLSFIVSAPVQGRQFFMTFVKKGDGVRYNIASALMEAMSLPPGTENIFPFSGFAAGPKKFQKLSDLDLLLVNIIYDDEMPHNISIDSVKPIFDRIYDKNLADLKHKKILFPSK